MNLLDCHRLGKNFGPNRVLDDVSFDLRPGEVHILAGENGAGKSTLIKILAGIHVDYSGEVQVAGRTVRFTGPKDARAAGISVIHQEMSLVDSLSVLDNIHLGREHGGLFLDRAAQRATALELCRQLDLDFTGPDLDRPLEQFSLSEKNRVEIAKALACDSRVLVMDEPTSALTHAEVERLFTLIAAIKRRGCGIIYISHKMDEIYRLADRITVLRDGRWVATAAAAECPQPVLIRQMIGRDLREQFPSRPERAPDAATPRLEISGLTVAHPDPLRPNLVQDFSLVLRPGEIVGLAGLQGSGATAVLQSLFGAAGRVVAGSVRVDGEGFTPSTPRRAIARGLAFVTADRKGSGLVTGMSVRSNLTLPALPRFSPGGVLRPGREQAEAAARVTSLQIRLHSLDQPVGTLSGGNQQKVVLAKWLGTEPRVLLLEEPTRGVDIGAKHEIYALMRQWAAEGIAVLLVSTEMPELLEMSDRVIVLHRGRVTAEFARQHASSERILAAAMDAAAPETSPRS